jgi:SAM-dependent methyltransferase
MAIDWEREAENWIAWARAPGHDAYWEYREAFFALLPPPIGPALEIGCGEGRVTRDLVARDYDIIGLDASPTLIRAARDADPSGRYLVGDAAKLPFEDASFDLVVAYNSLMDVEDMPAAVKEARRVLKPTGRFCVCITHPTEEAGQFATKEADAPFIITEDLLTARWREVPFDTRGLQMTFRGWVYPLEQYSKAFEQAGLVIEAIREPPISDEWIRRDPTQARWSRIPLFMMLRLAPLTAAH